MTGELSNTTIWSLTLIYFFYRLVAFISSVPKDGGNERVAPRESEGQRD